MGRTKTWKALVRALALAGWVWAPAQEPGQERRFVVEPRLVHQTMAGFGAGFNQDAEKLMRTIAAPQDRERAYDLLYGDAGARLSVVRIVVSPDASPLPPGSATRYDWAHDKATQEELPSVRAALTRTKALLYAVPFTPPAGWKDNGLPSKGHLMPAHDQEYADYLADFLGYFQDQGLGIQVLSVQNEPGVAAPWHSCLWSGERLRDFLKVLGGAVRAKSLDTRLMLSEGTSWSGAWSHLGPALADPTSRKLLGVLASHSYGDPLDPARTRFAQAAKATGLPVWTTEMSLMQPPQPDDPGMKAALRVAGYIHRDLTEADAAAWIYCFAIFRSRFQGSMGVLSPSDGDAGGALRVPKRALGDRELQPLHPPRLEADGGPGRPPRRPRVPQSRRQALLPGRHQSDAPAPDGPVRFRHRPARSPAGLRDLAGPGPPGGHVPQGGWARFRGHRGPGERDHLHRGTAALTRQDQAMARRERFPSCQPS